MDLDLENDDNIMTGGHSRFDSVWLGLTIGLVVPVLAFLMFYYSSFSGVSLAFFIENTMKLGAFINVLINCMVPDLLIFSLFMWRKHHQLAKGMVIASVSLTVLIVLVKAGTVFELY